MIVYFSLTGQTRRFVNKLPDQAKLELTADGPIPELHEPYILVVPTYVEEVTFPVNRFLDHGDNLSWCRGSFGGGNRNFAELFCFTVEDLEEDYGIPVLHKFEFQGSDSDVARLEEELAKIVS